MGKATWNMIGNPVKIMQFGQCNEQAKYRWLALKDLEIVRATVVSEETGELENAYYPVIDGVPIMTCNGCVFKDRTVALSEGQQAHEVFINEWRQVWKKLS